MPIWPFFISPIYDCRVPLYQLSKHFDLWMVKMCPKYAYFGPIWLISWFRVYYWSWTAIAANNNFSFKHMYFIQYIIIYWAQLTLILLGSLAHQISKVYWCLFDLDWIDLIQTRKILPCIFCVQIKDKTVTFPSLSFKYVLFWKEISTSWQQNLFDRWLHWSSPNACLPCSESQQLGFHNI